MRNILGLIKPDHGSIKIDGVETDNIPRKTHEMAAKQIGVLFQNAALFDSLTIWENIAFDILEEGVFARK